MVTSVLVGAQEITWIKPHRAEDSPKPVFGEPSKTDHTGEVLLKRWKITSSSLEQSGFTRKLGENVSDKEAVITGDVQWRVCFDTWICGAAPHSPWVPPRQSGTKSFVTWMPQGQQQEFQPCTLLFAERFWDPQNCCSLQRRYLFAQLPPWKPCSNSNSWKKKKA